MSDEATTRLDPASGKAGPDTARGAFGLPGQLLARARRRLATFVLFIGGLVTVTVVIFWLAPIDWPIDASFLALTAVAQVILLTAHGVFYWMIRDPRLGHALILNLGLAYEVVLVLTIAVGNHWLNYTQGVDYDDRVFAALVIALYPIVVPSPPWRAFWSSLAAAAMLPLGILLLHAFGMPGTSEQYLVASVIGLSSVAVALFGSRVIYGMNVAVAEARRLGSYELESRLGQGGMGEVWRARHRLLARPAAVKLIRPAMLGTSDAHTHAVLRRFEREAQATAALRSAHTIQLYDFGISRDGTFYYVMELLEGLDLDRLVSRFGPVPAARAVHLLRQACDSLAEAHDAGLIHRDIKPANIYVCRYGRHTDFVKVLDFGLVTADPETGADDIMLTADHVVRGTPAFMAPEQVTGDRTVDGRTDLYALGCVGYWLLTGRPVFESTSPMEAMMQHLKEPPTPPSVTASQPVPDAVDRALLACLEKDPDRRPQSADALDAILAACAATSPWSKDTADAWWNAELPHDPAGVADPFASR